MARKPLSALKHRGPLASGSDDFHVRRMTMEITLGLMAIMVALTAFAGWRGSLPPNLVKGPRMIPWRPLMVCFAATVAFLGAHAAALLGFAMNR